MPKKYRRNANGSGTVTKMSGNRRRPWRALLPAMQDDNGDYKQQTLGYYETRDEALEALAMHKYMPTKTDRNITADALFEQLTQQWYKNLSPQAIRSYNSAWVKFKSLHRTKIADIRTPQIQYCIDKIAENDVSSATLNNMKLVFSKLEDMAMQQDIINKNYAKFVVLPKKEKKEKDTLSDLHLEKIRAAAEGGNEICKHILILCNTGWRIQEYCNLTIFDYDADNHTLTGGLKTEAGKDRTVPVPDAVVPLVEEMFRENGNKIITLSAQNFRKKFAETLQSLGIEGNITPHSTRHTYNERLYIADVPIETRMMLMGQSDKTTNRKVYTHSDINKLSEAVSKLG